MAPEYLAPGVLVEEVPLQTRPIRGVDVSSTVFIGQFGPAVAGGAVRVVSAWAEMASGPAGDVELVDREVVRQFFANGGRRAVLVGLGVGAEHRSPASVSEALARADDQLEHAGQLAIPAMAFMEHSDFATVVRAAEQLCERRRALLLVDPPSGAEHVGGPWTATYSPAITVRSERGTQLDIPASGTVAGVIARFDADRGVWTAPAGTAAVVRGAIVRDLDLEPGELDRLNRLGVNLLRRLGRFGVVVWGARTGASGANDYRYVPVRRLGNFLERSIAGGLDWVVFEPNDEPLWSAVELSVSDFVHRLFRQGAFAAGSPNDAYFVKCGRGTTTEAEIDRGIVNIEVGFAPLRPAEFVVIQLQIRTSQTPR